MSSLFSIYDLDTVPLLPAFIKPYKDELFSSWLVRLAHAHDLKVQTFVKILFPKKEFWNRDIDRSVDDEIVVLLSKRTNCSVEEIKNTTLKRYQGWLLRYHNHKTNAKWFLPLGVYHRKWKQNGIVFCPGCLEQDGQNPYFRIQWRLSLSFVCVKCQINLHEKCPNCKVPVTFFRADFGNKEDLQQSKITDCYHCKYDLTKALKVKADSELLKTQYKINEILEFGWNEEVIYPFLFFEVLIRFLHILINSSKTTESLKSSILKYHPLTTKIKLTEGNKKFECLPIEQRGSYLNSALWLFFDWPNRFIKIVGVSKTYSSYLIKDMPEVPFWYDNVVKAHFYLSNRVRIDFVSQ